MTTSDLLAQLGFSHYCIVTNVDSVTDEQALQEPAPSGNPMNYVLGHILSVRNRVFEKLGSRVYWSDEIRKLYNTSWKRADKSKLLSLTELTKCETETHAQLKSAIENFAGPWDEKFAEPSVGGTETLGEFVQFFLLHETYHAGQLGSLRRTLALRGKIGQVED
jgi:uncharacterized damage-inducible protein DinB